MRILIYGYGNIGRQDDGLGVLLADLAEEWIKSDGITDVEVDRNYQLNIEDAYRISEFDLVIFADATQEEIEDVKLTDVKPDESKIEFSMHAVSPAFIMDLCSKLYHRTPKIMLLHLRGYQWEFNATLSVEAKINLAKGFSMLKQLIKERLV